MSGEKNKASSGSKTKKILFYLLCISGFNWLYEKWSDKSIFIVGYHSVGGLNKKISVDSALFEQQIQFLHDHGHTSILCRDLAKIDLNISKPTAFYFDDGYKDNVTTALPILEKYGMRATFFIVPKFIDQGGVGNSEYMNWDDVKELRRRGHEIGAHTWNHTKLTEVPLDMAKREIEESKRIIEEYIGEPVTSFSYPKGGVNDGIEALVRQAGFTCAVTTRYGTNSPDSIRRQPFRLRKVAPRVYESFSEFTVRLYSANWFYNILR